MMRYDELRESESDSEGDQSQRTQKTPDRVQPQAEQSVDTDELVALRLENKDLKQELEFLRQRIKDLEDELLTKTVQLGATTEYEDDEDRDSQRQFKRARFSSKKWSLFTKEEDEKIMNFLKKTQLSYIGIRSGTWEAMKSQVFPDSPHTVQSLENRYRKSIAPNLDNFFHNQAELDKYKRRVESPMKKGKK